MINEFMKRLQHSWKPVLSFLDEEIKSLLYVILVNNVFVYTATIFFKGDGTSFNK
jgi:hypothetical protein